ncbi:hypothetical protein Cgig2_003998 [Carnegiea gigantea]|uniref:Homeobox domain-containing protein n=1 Tax=Carnegiea gigantea TaxID=171969 RepID=A0A9Q1QF72_9CARY|nr:hypothetical protein Cgig2_003998 [Carnegiea gigantea]
MPPAASTRWCPTPEQVMLLEEMYRGGVRTPSAAQIQQITAHLSMYGKIEGKNVFYWFQNHKARDRQKLKKKLLLLHGNYDRTQPPILVYHDHLHHNFHQKHHHDDHQSPLLPPCFHHQPPPFNCSSPTFPPLAQRGHASPEMRSQNEECYYGRIIRHLDDDHHGHDLHDAGFTRRPLKTLELFPIKEKTFRNQGSSSHDLR